MEPTTPTFMPTAPANYADALVAVELETAHVAESAGGAGSDSDADSSVSIPANLIILDEDTPTIVADWFKINVDLTGPSQDSFHAASFQDAYKLSLQTIINGDTNAVTNNNMILVVEDGVDSAVTVRCVIAVPAANGDAVNSIVMGGGFNAALTAALAPSGITLSGTAEVSHVLNDAGDTTFDSLFGATYASLAQTANAEKENSNTNTFLFAGIAAGVGGVLIVAGVLMSKRFVVQATASTTVATPTADSATASVSDL